MNKILSRAKNAFLKYIGKAFAVNGRLMVQFSGLAPYDLHHLEEGPNTAIELTKEDAVQYFTTMTLIRKMETAFAGLYQKKEIRGFCHLYSGQEAIAVGLKAAMRPIDSVITSYRCHGWTLLQGVSLEQIVGELLGKKSGVSRGKGGSMHMYGQKFYGGNGIVGAHVPLGGGIALAHKYKKDGGVCITLFGEGASNQGQVFECYNQAYLQRLPVMFVVENNRYAMGTSAERGSANTNFYTRGDVIPGVRLDGMDVLAVREAGRFAIDYLLRGTGPIVLEVVTYRYFGHSLSDPGTSYRTRQEVKDVRDRRDPIRTFKEKIVHAGFMTEEETKKIDDEMKKKVDDAVKKAKSEKEVPIDELYYDVYKDYKGKFRTPGFNQYHEHKNVAKWTEIHATQ